MLILGIYSASQLLKMAPALEKKMKTMPAFSSLCNQSMELKKNEIYSFKLDVEGDMSVLSKLALCPKEETFSCSASLLNLQQQVLAPLGYFPQEEEKARPMHQHSGNQTANNWTTDFQLLKSHISSVAEARLSQEISPSFTPSKERQAVDRQTQAFLENARLTTQQRLAKLDKLRQEKELGNLLMCSDWPGSHIKPVLVKSGSVSPNTDEAALQLKKRGDIDYDKENLTPNIKARFTELTDSADPFREDFCKEDNKENSPINIVQNQPQEQQYFKRRISNYSVLQELTFKSRRPSDYSIRTKLK